MQALFDKVRARCTPQVWSRGVELTRADAVTGVRADADEIVVRIATKGGLICPVVTFDPREEDWECSCGARACEHAAAAVISLRRARESGNALPAPRIATGHIGYRLSRSGGALALERVVVLEREESPVESTLAAAVGRGTLPSFQATPEDLSVELALGTHRRGPLPRGLWSALLPLLGRCPDVLVDGKPLRVSTDAVGPVGRLEEQGDGFRLSVREDETVTEVFHNGVALCGDLLRPVGETRLTGRELHELPRGKYYGPDTVAELVTEVLPSLRRRIRVEIATKRLPETTSEAPRIVLDLTHHGTTLSVLPTLVYGDPPVARVDGGRVLPLRAGAVPIRDMKAEQRLLRTLEAHLGLAAGIRSDFDSEEAVAMAARLGKWDGELRGRPHVEPFRLLPPLVPRVGMEGERLDVVFESPATAGAGRSGRADPGAVLAAWRQGKSLCPLMEGGFAPLPADWLSRYGHRIADLLGARDADGRLAKCAFPDLAGLLRELDVPLPSAFDELRHLAQGFEQIPDARLPHDLTAALRPYQKEGARWLAFLKGSGLGALLADDMGLGKTVQALCVTERRTLVVCPTSVLHNWVDEIRKFRPGLRHSVYHGPRRALEPDADVTLTTYAILRSDEEALAGETWDTAVLDEAQNIKNPDSQVARAAFRLRAGFRVALTGTPVENRLEELWSQLRFLNPGLLGSREDFDARYARPIADGEPGVAARLRQRIRPFVLRRLKEEVAPELPPRSDSVLYCALEPQEREVYGAIHAATYATVVERLQEGGSVLAALEALLRLRQAACHSGLVPGQTAEGSSKVTRLVEALDTVLAERHKALVFSQWTSLLDRIEPHLRAASIDFVRLDGSTRDRGAVVGRFQSTDGPPVMLVSLKAGGTGLNLTAADHVFLMDPWWNPAVEDQAADRAHRIGQDRPVLVYRLVAEDTIEERILALQESKRSLADAALADADRAVSLTRDDLLFLLSED